MIHPDRPMEVHNHAKTVYLLDYHQTGHHLSYLKLYSEALLKLGCRLVTFSSAPEQIRQWLLHQCPEQSHQFHVLPIRKEGKYTPPVLSAKLPNPLTVLERWIYASALVRRAAQQTGKPPDLVFFNCIDSYFSGHLDHQIIDRIFPYAWSGLYLQAELELLKDKLNWHHHWSLSQSPHCRALATLDTGTSQKLQKTTKTRVVSFPDITDESDPDPGYELTKLIQQKAQGRKIIGLVGSLSKRKGMLTLLEVAQNSIHENFFFVFAGQLHRSDLSDEEYLKFNQIIDSPPDNCFFHLERIPGEAQFNALINLFDIVFAAYLNFPNSSNILTKAAIFRKPIIVSKGFCMSERVEEFELGSSIREGSASDCFQAIHELSHELDANTINHPFKFRFDSYRSLNSFQNLQSNFSKIIDLMY